MRHVVERDDQVARHENFLRRALRRFIGNCTVAREQAFGRGNIVLESGVSKLLRIAADALPAVGHGGIGARKRTLVKTLFLRGEQRGYLV